MTDLFSYRYFVVNDDDSIYRLPNSKTDDYYFKNPDMSNQGGRTIDVLASRIERKLTEIVLVRGRKIKWDEKGNAIRWLTRAAGDIMTLASQEWSRPLSMDNTVVAFPITQETYLRRYCFEPDPSHIQQICDILKLKVPSLTRRRDGNLVEETWSWIND